MAEMDRRFWLERALENLKALKGKSVNEEDTKRLIIEPLLAWIGYYVWEPGEVKEQYRIERRGGSYVDYALTKPGSEIPYLLIEAKSLGDNISSQVEQVIDYCNYSKGARFGVITDGEKWLLLDEHWKERAAKERKIYEFTVNQKIGEHHKGYDVLCLLHPEHERVWAPWVDKIRKLWETGVEEAIEAVIAKAIEKIEIPTGEERPLVTPKPEEGIKVAAGEWPKDLITVTGKTPPGYVLIDGEKSRDIRSWNDLLVYTAEWLAEKGKINQPVKLPGSKLFIINDRKEQPSSKNKKIKGKFKPINNAEGFYVWTYLSGAGCIRQALALLEHFGYSPDILKPPKDWKS